MAKQSKEQKLMHQWWVRVLLAAIFLGLSYGFVYLATDSGSIWQYVVAIIFFVWAIKYIVQGIRFAISR